MEKILVLGVGAQGSTAAERLGEHSNVEQIICADFDTHAVDSIVSKVNGNSPGKAKGIQVDASKKEDIAMIASDVDLIVDALPTQVGFNAVEAALEVKTNYQNFTAGDLPAGADGEAPEWLKAFEMMFEHYGPRFEDIGKTAVICTGSAPGLINVVVSDAMRYLDTCETINLFVYEGVEAKRDLPFWWSPEVALGDMVERPYVFEDGKIIQVDPFSGGNFKEFKGVEEPIRMVNHLHDEQILIGMHADTHFKGCRNANFQYGGVGVEYAEGLYNRGLLSQEKSIDIGGEMYSPFELMVKMLPPAPKYEHEITEILEEGLKSDTGAMLVQAFGRKDGKDVRVDTYVYAPGCAEAFERSGLTGEMYLTGQGGYLFTELLLENKFHQKGVISADMLTESQVASYLQKAEALDIRLDTKVVPLSS